MAAKLDAEARILPVKASCVMARSRRMRIRYSAVTQGSFIHYKLQLPYVTRITQAAVFNCTAVASPSAGAPL